MNKNKQISFAERYQDIVKHAELGEMSHARGCMVIKPWGYGIWELMQQHLNVAFKKCDVENAYFPLFIPLEYIAREAGHVSGFAKEMAIVTHKALKANHDGELEIDGELENPLVVRPTSETIIGESMSNWINSHRDLPLKLNQWANVVRWERRPRIFLRTVEFLWQEGHTAFATKPEALADIETMITVYQTFVQDKLAVPVIVGEKPPSERFPGADQTLCIEAMMQDGKALQAGTAHYLGQNFSKAMNISFSNQDNQDEYAYTTSWGVSTRLIGALVMTHSDDHGFRVPPKIAPYHIAIIPMSPKKVDDAGKQKIIDYCNQLKHECESIIFDHAPVRVKCEAPQQRSSDKKWSWVKKGIPIVIEIGLRDVENGNVAALLRTAVDSKPAFIEKQTFITSLPETLTAIQDQYYQEALQFQEQKTVRTATTLSELKSHFKGDDSVFVWAYWNGDEAILDELKELAITIRCIPRTTETQAGTCIFSQEETTQCAVFAKAY
ncbi:proline--tRNA ligase [Candidatus Marinamargulisbacteria bacterium SCGC AG-414-C22]|nr:proline--tRNA ligase [Candidatus Marinamargulisbacteria bacterium SCGC AG-414-C22]